MHHSSKVDQKRREMAIAAKLTAERGKLPEEVVTEVSKKTLGSYVKKAATEIGTSAIILSQKTLPPTLKVRIK